MATEPYPASAERPTETPYSSKVFAPNPIATERNLCAFAPFPIATE